MLVLRRQNFTMTSRRSVRCLLFSQPVKHGNIIWRNYVVKIVFDQFTRQWRTLLALINWGYCFTRYDDCIFPFISVIFIDSIFEFSIFLFSSRFSCSNKLILPSLFLHIVMNSSRISANITSIFSCKPWNKFTSAATINLRLVVRERIHLYIAGQNVRNIDTIWDNMRNVHKYCMTERADITIHNDRWMETYIYICIK